MFLNVFPSCIWIALDRRPGHSSTVGRVVSRELGIVLPDGLGQTDKGQRTLPGQALGTGQVAVSIS